MFPDQDTPHASPGTVPGYSFCLGVPCPWAPSVLCTSDTDRRRGSPPSPTWSGRALGQACRGLVFFPMVTTEEDPSETEGEAWLLRHRPLYGNQRACDFDGTPELADLGGGGEGAEVVVGPGPDFRSATPPAYVHKCARTSVCAQR